MSNTAWKSIGGVFFLLKVLAGTLYFMCKNGFGTISLQTIEVFILFTKAPLLWPCHAQSMNIFGQSKLQTDDE